MTKTINLYRDPKCLKPASKYNLRGGDGRLFACINKLAEFFPSAKLPGKFSLKISTKPFPRAKSVIVVKNDILFYPILFVGENPIGVYGALQEVLDEIVPEDKGKYPVYFRLIHHH